MAYLIEKTPQTYTVSQIWCLVFHSMMPVNIQLLHFSRKYLKKDQSWKINLVLEVTSSATCGNQDLMKKNRSVNVTTLR